jgi:hypothetical protein
MVAYKYRSVGKQQSLRKRFDNMERVLLATDDKGCSVVFLHCA